MPACTVCHRKARVGGRCIEHSLNKCKCGAVANVLVCARCGNKKYKAHEFSVRDVLEEEGLDNFVHNKRLRDTKFLPDFFFDGEHKVILEVDEYGHDTYDSTKELKRMRVMSEAIKEVLIIFRLYVPCAPTDIQMCIQVLRRAIEDGMVTETQTDKIKVYRYFMGCPS